MDRRLHQTGLVRMRLGLVVSCLATVACGPSLSADAEWVEWFSYRVAHDLAVSPAGEAVVVGHTTSDEYATYSPFGQYTWRPWIARIDATGDVVAEHVGFLGRAGAVALDDQGRAYVVLDGVRDDQYWGTLGRAELWALDEDGATRWTQSWPAGSYVSGVAVAGEVVVVTVSVFETLDGESGHTEHLEAFDLDGGPRWQQPLDRPHGPLVAAEDELWIVGEEYLPDGEGSRAMAWRLDARDGATQELRARIDDAQSVEHYVATPEGLLVTTRQGDGYSAPPSWSLVSLDREGNRRWEQQVVPASSDDPSDWAGDWAWPFSDGHEAWVMAGESRVVPSDEDLPPVDHRMLLQRWAADGGPEGSLRQAFEDRLDDPRVLARRECPATDAEGGPPVGSEPFGAAVHDGSLWVIGRQDCRDAFLLKLEVEP